MHSKVDPDTCTLLGNRAYMQVKRKKFVAAAAEKTNE